MLSYNVKEKQNTEYPNLKRAINVLTASGYMVNHKYYDTLIKLYEYAMPKLNETRQHWIYANDVIWTNLQKTDNWYLFTTRIGRQRDGYSDNSESFVKYIEN